MNTHTVTTDAALIAALRAVNMSCRKADGEYRVAPSQTGFPGLTAERRESLAYYTDDREDALRTGMDMFAQLS